MLHSKRFHQVLLALLLAVPWLGCRVPLPDEPLSDESTSRIDERLLGEWEIDVRPLAGKIHSDDGLGKPARYQVTQAKGKQNTLRVESKDDGKQGFAWLYTTHLGMRDYLSWGPLNQEDKRLYLVCLYEFENENSGRLYLLSNAYMGAAIEDGKLAGEARRADSGSEPFEEVHIKATREQLLEFIGRHSPGCFDRAKPLTCRKLPDRQ